MFSYYQTLQTDVNSHQAEIVAVSVLGHSVEGLIRVPDFERGKSINQRYDELCANISVYQAKLQSALTNSQNFKDGLEVAIKALTELKKQLDKLPPVSRNLIELRNQAQQFKVMWQRLRAVCLIGTVLHNWMTAIKKIREIRPQGLFPRRRFRY